VSPVLPFIGEHLWKSLVSGPCPDAPESVHLAGWPAPPAEQDPGILAEMGLVRKVVETGRRARMEANIRLRQPIRKVVVRGADGAKAHAEEILEELRAKELSFDEDTRVDVTVKPNFPVAGPRLGGKIKEVAAALASGDFRDLDGGGVEAAGETLSAAEVIRTEKVVMEGWVVAHDGHISVAIDPALDEELIEEGNALELIRSLNEQRKQEGLALTDRISLRLPESSAPLLDRYRDRIAGEVLATSIEIDPGIVTPHMSIAPTDS
jgi:isoleucyl-tRNA synthetase